MLNDLMILMKTPTDKKDTHFFGTVDSINEDGTYEVDIGRTNTVTCGKITGAEIGDTVLVLTMSNGHSVVIGTIGGDKDIIAIVDQIAEIAGKALENRQLIDNLASRIQALEDRV